MATKKAASAKKTAKDVVKKAVAAVKKTVAKATTPAPKKAAAKAAPAPAKKAAPAAKTAPAAKKAAAPAKATPAKKAAPAAKATATKTSTTKSTPTKSPTTKSPAKKVVEVPKKAAPTKAAASPEPAQKPKRTLGGGTHAPSHGHHHEHDTKFLEEQRALLLEEREQYVTQAAALKAEADQLAAEAEGESEFTEEGGDVDSMSAERERDLALASQARQNIEEIDRALAKIDQGTYGLCERCGQPIVKARLKALPYASLCVACKSGGLSARR